MVLLSLLLIVSLGAGVYLYVVATAWQERAEDLEAAARGIGADLADVAAERDDAATALASAQEQLAQTQDQLADLADAVAQTGDDREVQRQVAVSQTQLSAAASNVAQALESCIQGQAQLIGYLDDVDAWEPESLENFRTQVITYCDQATDAYERLQAQIDGS